MFGDLWNISISASITAEVSNLGSIDVTHKRLSVRLLVICVQGVVERWRQFGRGINVTSIFVCSESLTDICRHFEMYNHLHCNTVWQELNRKQYIDLQCYFSLSWFLARAGFDCIVRALWPSVCRTQHLWRWVPRTSFIWSNGKKHEADTLSCSTVDGKNEWRYSPFTVRRHVAILNRIQGKSYFFRTGNVPCSLCILILRWPSEYEQFWTLSWEQFS